jgi:hypothetical protein
MDGAALALAGSDVSAPGKTPGPLAGAFSVRAIAGSEMSSTVANDGLALTSAPLGHFTGGPPFDGAVRQLAHSHESEEQVFWEVF